MQLLTYDFVSIPESLEVGDTGYYASSTSSQGGFTTVSSSNIVAFGIVTNIDHDSLPPTVTFAHDDHDYNNDGIVDITPPQQGDFIMFGKNNVVNSSSLVGYYAEAKFVNTSREKAELFSVGSEISESSR